MTSSSRTSAGSPSATYAGLQVMEWLTLAHVGGFAIATTWAFAGQADWVRTPLGWWGTAGVAITAAAATRRSVRRATGLKPWLWALPVIAFNALVLLACLHPSFRSAMIEGQPAWLAEGDTSGWPSTAVPALTRNALWLFDAAWISAFNLVLVVRRRRTLRLLLLALAANALVLSVFGTVQKLSHASGLYFGAVPSPQVHFFATFVYHNHWGAFSLLMLAVCLGLGWHYGRRYGGRDIFHSPLPTAALLVLLIAATIPLSASRSSTVLATVLLAGAALHGSAHVIGRRRAAGQPVLPTIAILVGVIGVACAGIWYVARDTIAARMELTVEQVDRARTNAGPDSRVELYRDTWHMAADRPWFGWGMGSYPYVFTLYNSRRSVDGLPVYYHDAHSDWLQSLAEHGVFGTAFIILAVLLPGYSVGRRWRSSTLALYLAAGCALVVVYGMLEFPFGNFAVVLVWWLCFYAAVQYARLQDRVAETSEPPFPPLGTSGDPGRLPA